MTDLLPDIRFGKSGHTLKLRMKCYNVCDIIADVRLSIVIGRIPVINMFANAPDCLPAFRLERWILKIIKRKRLLRFIS